MIIRKPTKIDLKPEDDQYEYEEYKRKLQESNRNNKPDQNNKAMRMQTEKLLNDSTIGNPFQMNIASEFFKPNQGQQVQIQGPNNESMDLGGNIEQRPDSMNINQLFSILLNNLGQSPQQNEPSSLNNSHQN